MKAARQTCACAERARAQPDALAQLLVRGCNLQRDGQRVDVRLIAPLRCTDAHGTPVIQHACATTDGIQTALTSVQRQLGACTTDGIQTALRVHAEKAGSMQGTADAPNQCRMHAEPAQSMQTTMSAPRAAALRLNTVHCVFSVARAAMTLGAGGSAAFLLPPPLGCCLAGEQREAASASSKSAGRCSAGSSSTCEPAQKQLSHTRCACAGRSITQACI